jgi:dihydroneopterin aldolase
MGIHGVLPEEQERPQPFEIDLELHVDLRNACRSDDLEDTVDYGSLTEAVAHVVATEHYALLERLAARIVEVCTDDPRVGGITVEVRKMEPPIETPVAHVGVRVKR